MKIIKFNIKKKQYIIIQAWAKKNVFTTEKIIKVDDVAVNQL